MKISMLITLSFLFFSQTAFSAKLFEMEAEYFERKATSSNKARLVREIGEVRVTTSQLEQAQIYPFELQIDEVLGEDELPLPPVKTLFLKDREMALLLQRFLQTSKNIHLILPYASHTLNEDELLGKLAFYDDKTKQVFQISKVYDRTQLKRKIEQLTYLEIFRQHGKDFESGLDAFINLRATGAQVTLPQQVADYHRYMRSHRSTIEFLNKGSDGEMSYRPTSPR